MSPPDANKAHQASRRALARLAVAVGLVVAAPPPLLTWWTGQRGLQQRAVGHARAVAAVLQRAAAGEPHLWRYGAGKTVARQLGSPALTGVASAQLLGCDGKPFGGKRLATVGGGGRGPAAYAAVGATALPVAFIRIEMDGGPLRLAVAQVAALSAAGGTALALLLWLGPFAAIGRAAQRRRAQVAAAEARLRGLGRSSLATVEAERARIARDLHDDLGQLLTALRLQIDAAIARNDASSLSAARARVEEATDGLRRVVADLRPAGVDDDDIAATLQAACSRAEVDLALIVGFRSEGDAGADPVAAAALLRVLREALHNAVRHGAASEVSVRLRTGDDGWTLEITDDGGGFAPAQATLGGRQWLHERLALLGGSLDIRSSKGAGATLCARLPRVEAST